VGVSPRRIGGTLGTERHNISLEQPSLSCRCAATPASGQRHAVRLEAVALASSMSASWE